MHKFRRDLIIILACYGVHALVYAAQLSLWQQLQTGDLIMDLFINLMSACCASVANTAFRLKNDAVVVSQAFKELAYGIGIGLTAGVITYSMAQAADANKFLQLALVTIAGWGGSKVIESYSSKYFGPARDKSEGAS